MNGSIMLPALVALPMAGAGISYILGRYEKAARDYFCDCVAAVELLMALYLFFMYAAGWEFSFRWSSFGAQGIYLALDGFRMIMVMVTAVMWLMVTVFSRRYLRHYKNRNRYYFFLLITLGAMMGVFLSAELFTTFLFFELMSFTSYVWVAHDETKEAMRAAGTYLAVAVIGGLVMLMGLMLLYTLTGTLEIDALTAACAKVEERGKLYAAGLCLLFGFGAKAGVFPLHIWLPKAHPVAPAPASALLSGILTKAGVFGVLVVSCHIFYQNMFWGKLIVLLGLITMVLGALLAVFSMNLKRVLACSSVSQIGFIMVGIGMQDLLGGINEMAVHGTLLHMVNHSLFKLVLFLCAGVVYMNLHALHLNDIRGFGKNKRLLMAGFGAGALGIAGVPLFSGYISKTLLHEAIVEYKASELAVSYGALSPTGAAWTEGLFLFSGGLTVAYMLKLFVALFIERHPAKQQEFDDMKKSYLNAQSALAFLVPALFVVLFGVLPHVFMDTMADMGQGFMNMGHAGHVGKAPAYFSWESLQGALISIFIGLIVYFGLVRTLLMEKDASGGRRYVERWPSWLDLEDLLYRPFLLKVLPAVAGIVFRACDYLMDSVILLCRSTTHRCIIEGRKVYMGTAFSDWLGRLLDGVAALLNKTVRRKNPIRTSYLYRLAELREETGKTTRMLVASLSFGLLLFCIGFCLVLLYLLL